MQARQPAARGIRGKVKPMDSNLIIINQQEEPVEKIERRSIKKKYVLIFLFVIFSLFMIFFLHFPSFKVQEISITGLDKVSAGEVLSATGLREGVNIWKVKAPVLRKQITSMPRIADVQVERILPGKIRILITEKYPLAVIPYHGSYFEIASDGLIIGVKDGYKGEYPLINGLTWGSMDVGTYIPDQIRGEIISVFLHELSLSPALPLAEVNVSDPDNILVYTWERMEVWLGGKQDLVKKLEVLQQLNQYIHLGENAPQKGYLDIRTVEGPVYVPLQ